jgi:hypothetical protein
VWVRDLFVDESPFRIDFAHDDAAANGCAWLEDTVGCDPGAATCPF